MDLIYSPSLSDTSVVFFYFLGFNYCTSFHKLLNTLLFRILFLRLVILTENVVSSQDIKLNIPVLDLLKTAQDFQIATDFLLLETAQTCTSQIFFLSTSLLLLDRVNECVTSISVLVLKHSSFHTPNFLYQIKPMYFKLYMVPKPCQNPYADPSTSKTSGRTCFVCIIIARPTYTAFFTGSTLVFVTGS